MGGQQVSQGAQSLSFPYIALGDVVIADPRGKDTSTIRLNWTPVAGATHYDVAMSLHDADDYKIVRTDLTGSLCDIRDISFNETYDFLDQMQSMKKMGGIKSMLEMLPGMSGKDIDVDENAMKKPEAIIRSMTPKERRNPGVLNASRRKRIAAGSGTTVQDVNQLIRQFDQAKQMMKQVTQMKGKGRMRMRFPGMR